MVTKTDVELLAAYCVSQDENAFGELVSRHGPMVYRVCLNLVGQTHEAEDCSQAVFVILVKKIKSLRKEVNLAAWLYGVARHVSLRAIETRNHKMQREERVALMRQASQENQNPADDVDLSGLKELVYEEMGALSAAERQAVILRYLEGRSEKESAEIIGCPQGTLSRRASQGLARLRERLAKRGHLIAFTALLGLLESEANAALPATLLPSILASSKLAASGSSAAANSGNAVHTLAEGALKNMFWTKMKMWGIAASILMAVGVLGAVTDRVFFPASAMEVVASAPAPIWVPAVPVAPVKAEPKEQKIAVKVEAAPQVPQAQKVAVNLRQIEPQQEHKSEWSTALNAVDLAGLALAISRGFEPEKTPLKAAVKPVKTKADGDPKPAAEKIVAVNKKPVPSPVSLSCLDGQQMVLEKCDVRIALHGPLSLVETEMVFRNTENRVREGRFLYLLPTGATISRFAKEVDGKLMEGEVLERLRAQAVYTEILHGMRDPALLETDQGNRFSARVFPIPANSTVRLLLSYSRLLPMQNGQRKLILPMAGMPKIGTFTFSTLINTLPGEVLIPSTIVDNMAELTPDELKQATRTASDYTPQKDIGITLDMVGDATAATSFQSGDYQMFSYQMPATDAAAVSIMPSEWNFFIDTSASNADTEKHRLATLDTFFKNLPQAQKMSASAFDISVAPLGDFTPETSAKIITALKDRHALGATNLVEVARQIGVQARANSNPQHFVLISDGIATLGSRESSDVLAALGNWPANDTLHALVIGQKQDSKMLAAITEKTHGRVIDLPLGDSATAAMSTVLEDLQTPLGSTCSLNDANANWVYPALVNDARPGSEVIFFSELKKGAASQPVLSEVSPFGIKKSTQLTLTPTPLHDFATLLQREGCRAYLDHLEQLEQHQTAPAMRAELRAKRLDASVKNRVLCPLTSLLVLETEQDYARFNLSRNALADVLVFGANGIELLKRTPGGQTVVVVRPRIDPNFPNTPVKTPPVVEAKSDEKTKEVMNAKFLNDLRKEVSKINGHGPSDFEAKPDAIMRGNEGINDAAKATREMLESATSKEKNNEDLKLIEETFILDRPDEGRELSGGGGNAGVMLDDPSSGVGGSDTSGFGRGIGSGSAHGSFGNARHAPTTSSTSASTVVSETDSDLHAVRPVATSPAPASTPPAPDADIPHKAYLVYPANWKKLAQRSVQDKEKVRQESARLLAIVQQQNQRQGPWAQQNSAKPDAQTLNALNQLVALNPLDRSLRNTYADLLMNAGDWQTLKAQAFEWMAFDSENPAVFEYLGKSAVALGDANLTLRAFTSIAEVAPNRAALLARSGWLLLTVQQYNLAEVLFQEALKNRQDDVNIYRGLALTLWMGGKFDASASVLENALSMNFNSRYGDAKRVLREELGYVLRSAIAQQEQSKTDENKTVPEARVDIFKRRAKTASVNLSKLDALRVTLCWETDANDVDLHIIDPNGEDCFYGHKNNQSGLELYSDQTQGLGPEVIRTDKMLNGTYHIGVNFFSAGPMGVSRGVVVIIQNNGMPKIVPFCLVPGGSDMRHVMAVNN